MKNRLLAIALVLALLISCVPGGVLAEGTQTNQDSLMTIEEETTQPVVVPAPHSHSAAHICEDCESETVNWLPWSDPNSLPGDSNHYYLTCDVTVTWRRSVKNGNDVVLCLNGYTISADDKLAIIDVNHPDSSLVISDCTAYTDAEGNYHAGQLVHSRDANVGAVYVVNGLFAMYGGKLTNNSNTQTSSAAGWSGGAIHGRNNARIELKNVELSDNTSTAEGGAVCLRDKATASFENVTFRNNHADRAGGAIYLTTADNDITLKDCIFENNTSGTTGGAIYTNEADVTAENCIFKTNRAASHGGAVYAYGGKLNVTGSTMQGNRAAEGGAIRLAVNAQAVLTDSSLTENHATTSGGAVFARDAKLTIKNSTVTKNTSDGAAGAIGFSNESSVLTLESGEISGNTRQPRQPAAFWCRARHPL